MSIEVRKLSKNFGSQKAVDSISFSIPKGQIVGFLGPNGAGKSTTMKLLTGQLRATGGQGYINQIRVEVEKTATKRLIGYLAEHNPLYLEMYVKEYLNLVAGFYGINNKEARVKEMIRLTDLAPEQDKKIEQLSKGYRQRVGLAAALIHDPEVLILDEPTTGLDPNQLVEVRALISEIGKNKTVILSTHILQEVEAICDRIIIIHRGRIVSDSLLEELKSKNERLEDIFRKLTNS